MKVPVRLTSMILRQWSRSTSSQAMIASDGGLRGYAGGVDRKEWLLKMEASTCLARQPLATAVEGENEKPDRRPEQALENPGD